MLNGLRRAVPWAVLGGVLLLAWWWLTAGKKHDDAHDEKPIAAVPVTVAPAVRRPVERRVAVVGTLEGIEEVTLTPKVEGRVQAILHNIDASLAPDTPVLVLDDVDHKFAEAEAQRALESDLAKVGLTVERLPARGKDEDAVVTALPMVVRARNLEENASRRVQRLLSVGTAVSPEELDLARTDLRVAQSNSQQQLIDARSAIASAREKLAKLHSAQQRLRDTTLRVPVPSPERLAEIAQARRVSSVTPDQVRYVLAQRLVAEGQLVRANSSGVLRLVLDSPLKLVVAVPERYHAEVRVGQPVWLEVDAYPGQRFQGDVLRKNPTIDRANRTFQVEVNIPNDDRRLRCGMFAKASIQTHTNAEALLVPEDALVSFAGVNKVFVVRGDKVVDVPVKPGERHETTADGRRVGWLEVVGAIQPGEQVVVSGQTKLADGTPVRIRGNEKTE